MYTAEFNKLKKTDSLDIMNAKLKAISLEFQETGPMMIDEYKSLLDVVNNMIDRDKFKVKEHIFDKHKNLYFNIDIFSKYAAEILYFDMSIVKREGEI